MDYRDLLKRYMRHVWNEEGTTFVPDTGARTSAGALSALFTVEEVAELCAIDDEVSAEMRQLSGDPNR